MDILKEKEEFFLFLCKNSYLCTCELYIMFKKNPLIQFAGVPVSGAEIKSCFPDLASPQKKLQSLEKSGEIIRLKRDLYIINPLLTGKETDVRLCANHIYGPSYVSGHWALRYYGMIPEGVFTITSATTKRSRNFQTPSGYFEYTQVPQKYFPLGVQSISENGVSFLMASREKALCDLILRDNYVPDQSVKALYIYLEEDMRFDMDIIFQLNADLLRQYALAGRKTRTLLNLCKIIERHDSL